MGAHHNLILTSRRQGMEQLGYGDEAPIIELRTDWLSRDASRSVEIAMVIALLAAGFAFAGFALV